MDEKAEEQLYSPNIAVAAAKKGKKKVARELYLDCENNSRDLSMPWVKDLPVHTLAAFFQRMPPKLKFQVEMTNHRVAEIMKTYGWNKWHSIDIVISPEHSSGSFRVNDSFTVRIGDVVDCLQVLLSRIRVRRFSMEAVSLVDDYEFHSDVSSDGEIDDDELWPVWKPDRVMKGVSNALLDALVQSKHDGAGISELRLDVPDGLIFPSTIGKVIKAFGESLTHVSTPALNPTAIGAIDKCDHLEALGFGRPVQLFSLKASQKNALKDALASKSSLKTFYLLSDDYTNPLDIFAAGVHHLNHLTIFALDRLNITNEPTAEQANLLSNLSILHIGSFTPLDRPKLVAVLRVATQLQRLHIEQIGMVMFSAGPLPGKVSGLVRCLADECYRSMRSLTFSAGFGLHRGTVVASMKYDKEFVMSPVLSHYGVMAFDERLHAFDTNLLKPPTTEQPPQIASIVGSRCVYKRLFRIDLTSVVRLSIGFDEAVDHPYYVRADPDNVYYSELYT